MTQANEMKVKMDMYAECREHAVATLADLVDHEVTDTCESVKNAYAEVLRHGVSHDRAKATFAAVKWLWATLETKEGEKLKEAESLVKSEKA